MSDEDDDQGVKPIPTDSILGGGGRPEPSDDQGIPPIETDVEQRGGGGDSEHKRG